MLKVSKQVVTMNGIILFIQNILNLVWANFYFKTDDALNFIAFFLHRGNKIY